jgi:hypothetical protein
MNWNRFNNIKRSPEGGEGGGGGEGGSGGSGGQGQQGSQGSQGQFVPLEKYTALEARLNQTSGKLGEYDQRFQQLESRLPKPKAPERNSNDPVKPRLSDYDFDKGGESEWDRYHEDSYKYRRHQEKVSEAQAQRETQSRQSREQAAESMLKNYNKAAREYKKANPTFDDDLAKTEAALEDGVKMVIMGRKNGPELAHHVAKNPKLADELNDAWEEDGAEGVIELLGTIRGALRARKEDSERPFAGIPRTGPFNSTSSSAPSRNRDEVFKFYHG